MVTCIFTTTTPPPPPHPAHSGGRTPIALWFTRHRLPCPRTVTSKNSVPLPLWFLGTEYCQNCDLSHTEYPLNYGMFKYRRWLGDWGVGGKLKRVYSSGVPWSFNLRVFCARRFIVQMVICLWQTSATDTLHMIGHSSMGIFCIWHITVLWVLCIRILEELCLHRPLPWQLPVLGGREKGEWKPAKQQMTPLLSVKADTPLDFSQSRAAA